MLPQAQRRFLLAAPLIALPFVCGIFYALGGGQGDRISKSPLPRGLNTELPGAFPDPKKVFLDKMGAYHKADQDSLRKHEYAQQDPYVRKPADIRPTIPPDPRADNLLLQLNRLQTTLQQPSPETPVVPVRPARPSVAETPENDPQLDRLNKMLDKVLRIQHPGDNRPTGAPQAAVVSETVIPADSSSNAIAAVVPSDQTLVSGGTVPLRLSEDIRVHGIRIASGSWLYGVATISGDRLVVHVRSIRDGRNLYPTDLQVHDLDGLPGIHIPDVLSQDVARESAGESVSGFNLVTADPSIGATAAEAGIQTAKRLLTRKARLVKVSIRAGYQVLLINSNTPPVKPNQPSSASVPAKYQPPGFVPGGSFLERCRSEGVELKLKGIYLQDSLLWFAMEWQNRSPIEYTPQYYRWVIRDRRSFKRTATQEWQVEPVYSPELTTVNGDSTTYRWIGFRPFAPGKDKELVLELGEKGGGRVLTLVIRPKLILNAKSVGP